MKIHLTNTGTTVEIPGGSSLEDLLEAIDSQTLGFTPICARVNNVTRGLDFQLFKPSTVEFLDRTSDSGSRAYVRSLCMMLYVAVVKTVPGASLRIEHSIAGGYYCAISGIKVGPDDIARLKAYMRRMTERDLRFERYEEPTEDVMALFERQRLTDKVQLLKNLGRIYTVYQRLDGVADYYYGCLAPSTRHIDVFDLTPYKDGILLRAFDPEDPSHTARMLNQDKLFDAFTRYKSFNHIVGINDVGQLNAVESRRHMTDLINVAEALHEKYIARISDNITWRFHRENTRFVLIAGPSSSGKTTFAKRLSIQLRTNLLDPVPISLDNYFVDRTHTPRDASGDYDYESLYALDLKQFNEDLTALLAGREVALPTYNFETGTRSYRGDTVRLTDTSIILLEGIHGLNPRLTADIDDHFKYRVYVSALTTLAIDDHNWVPTTDNRLLRRIVRDYKYRGTSALDTLKRWPGVRRGEEKWIFPYQENADAMFNSSLLFELGVLKDRALEILSRVPQSAPEYTTAYRLMKLLSYFRSIPMELAPPTSLIREFLGGSAFHY